MDNLFDLKLIVNGVSTGAKPNIYDVEDYSKYNFIVIRIKDYAPPQNNSFSVFPIKCLELNVEIALTANGGKNIQTNTINYVKFLSKTRVEIGSHISNSEDSVFIYYM